MIKWHFVKFLSFLFPFNFNLRWKFFIWTDCNVCGCDINLEHSILQSYQLHKNIIDKKANYCQHDCDTLMYDGARSVLCNWRFHWTWVGVPGTQLRSNADFYCDDILLCCWNFSEFFADCSADFVVILAAITFKNVKCSCDVVFRFCNDEASASIVVLSGSWLFL